MQPIKRTRSRRYPLILRAESERGGPYVLVDLAGFGAAWRQIAHERVPVLDTVENIDDPRRGRPFARRATWVPIFRRAALAFELCELEPELTARDAKAISDRAWKCLGASAASADVERFALHLLEAAPYAAGRRALDGRDENWRTQ